jgi:hypothetical protein
MAFALGLRARRIRAAQLVLVGLVVSGPLVARQAPDAGTTLTVTIKGSPVYAQPTPVPIKTALLVITPSWQGLNATTPTGGREASGQPLWVTDVVVFLSNQEIDCAQAFKAKAPSPSDFIIAAGRTEAYLPSAGWQNTQLGKMFADAGNAGRKVPLERFSVESQYTSTKPRRSGKDNLRGSDGRLILEQGAGGWIADIMVKVDDLSAEGKVPVKSCGVTMRTLEETPPLLGEHRLQSSADRFGM